PRQCLQLGPRERQRVIDFPPNLEGPLRQVDGGDVAVVEDGPLGGFDLTGGQAPGLGSSQIDRRHSGLAGVFNSSSMVIACGRIPKTSEKPSIMLSAARPHKSRGALSPSSRCTLVMVTPEIPQGTIRSKYDRSVVTLSAKPCQVTQRFT